MKYYSAFELIDMLSKYCEVIIDYNLKVKYIVAKTKGNKIIILNAHEKYDENEVKNLISFLKK